MLFWEQRAYQASLGLGVFRPLLYQNNSPLAVYNRLLSTGH